MSVTAAPGVKHNIDLANLRIGKALEEMVSDRLGDVIRHYKDDTVAVKASKIKIEITVEPDERRQQFDVSLAATTSLAPRKTYADTVYARVTDEDNVLVHEHDPDQLRMTEF